MLITDAPPPAAGFSDTYRMGGLFLYWTPGWRHSQVPAMSPAAAAQADTGPKRVRAARVAGVARVARTASLSCFMAISSLVIPSPALPERYPALILRAGVVGARTDDFTVDSL